MKRASLLSVFLTFCFIASAINTEALSVKRFTLSNGMEVWINEDHSQPKAVGAVVVKAGASDCPGTGIAHYFEHIMFKGTEKIGTVDYSKEKPYLDSIEVLYDQLAETKSDSIRGLIQMEINRLNIAASEYAIPNEYSNLISECGGSHLNAFTSQDITVYHNHFLPTYLEQWAELNSERLIDPVFRLFQGELETVYEEKNRFDNKELSAFSQMIAAEGFKGSPYQYQVIGTTENLKNPQLSQMKDFFKKYYVAGNMGIMLTGDIDAKKALPILEKTFGRIRKGSVVSEKMPELEPFNGRKEVSALAKIPLVKLNVLCFRAPSSKDKDCLDLSFLAFMLNNSEGIGMLDKLATDRKILGAFCLYPEMAFEEAGLLPILIMPRLLFQKSEKAEKIVTDVLAELKAGNFSDDYFNSCKMTYKRNLIANVESAGQRVNEMVTAYAHGKNWEDVLKEIELIDDLTKEDIVELANKYFSNDYLVIKKKVGNPEKDDIAKPKFKKVEQKNTGVSSNYAQQIRSAAEKKQMPRIALDFSKDAQMTKLTDRVSLYSVANPVNDVFMVKISYPVGTIEKPAADLLSQYMNLIGTESLDYEALRAELQEIGGSINFSADRNSFNILIGGFDKYFDETMQLAFDLIDNPKGDKKKVKIIKENLVANKIMIKRDVSEIDLAAFHKVLYGENSKYLKDIGKISVKSFSCLFDEIKSFEFDIHYSGTLANETVASVFADKAIVLNAVNNHPYYENRKVALSNENAVYFIHKKKATQSKINAIVLGEKCTDMKAIINGQAFAEYMGGGMGSVLFQEIREFRSMAYNTGSFVVLPNFINKDNEPTVFNAYVGTQSDKTIEAIAAIDSLLKNIPLDERRAKMTAKDIWYSRINNYPDMREVSTKIANERRQGFSEDNSMTIFDLLEQYDSNAVHQYWKEQIEGRNIVWTVVGDEKKFNKADLAKFGTVKELKVKDVIK